MTAEAALSLPIFLLAMAALLFLFYALGDRTDLEAAMKKTGEEWVCAGLQESAILAGARVRDHLEEDGASLKGVKNGTEGISFLGSSLWDGSLTIRAEYHLAVPWFAEDLFSFDTSQSATFRAWDGSDGLLGGSASDAEYVYVTPYGSVYHMSLGCSYLDLSVRAVSLRSARSSRSADGSCYYACSCAAGAQEDDTVYITDYGNRYHRDRNCSGLKRGIQRIPLSDVSGMGACHKCGGH